MQPEHTVAKDGSWEKWTLNGMLYRKDGPAYIRYRGDHSFYEEWYSGSVPGVRHREGGPAAIWYEGGKILEEEWWFEGGLHKKDDPAIIRYNKDEKITEEQWWVNDKRHRANGPAAIIYKDGKTIKEEWYLNGKPLRKANFTSIAMIDRMKAYSLFSPIEIARMRSSKA